MENVLEVKNISTEFKVGKQSIKIVKDVSLDIKRGQILGVVGESGCGKSVTVHSMVNLLPKNGRVTTGSSIFRDGEKEINLLKMKQFSKDMRAIRGSKISMIFQDPMQSLNPVYSVGSQITESILEHRDVSKKEARNIAVDMLEKLGIPEAGKRFDEFPHQFSGGMKQRAMIAIAMVNSPDLLIADEPTTALDVTIQAQIMDLMKDLRDKEGKSVVLITHNMGLIAEVADQVAVMYMGRVVEHGDVIEVFENPSHPYTKALLKSVPVPGMAKNQKLFTIKGETPDPKDYVTGCEFAPRCKYSMEECKEETIDKFAISPTHKVRCLLYEKTREGRDER